MPCNRKEYYKKYHKRKSTKIAKEKWMAVNCPTLTTINSILLAFSGSGEGFGLKMKEE